MRSVSAFVLLAFAAQLAAQDRRPLTHDDYDQWKSRRGQTYTQDGGWVAFQVEPQWGDGALEIPHARTHSTLAVHRLVAIHAALGARGG
ncbi:MAG: hypothetical protein ACK56S_06975, partial [Planctomycetota bacterium]